MFFFLSSNSKVFIFEFSSFSTVNWLTERIWVNQETEDKHRREKYILILFRMNCTCSVIVSSGIPNLFIVLYFALQTDYRNFYKLKLLLHKYGCLFTTVHFHVNFNREAQEIWYFNLTEVNFSPVQLYLDFKYLSEEQGLECIMS